jgi:hypothetical protein
MKLNEHSRKSILLNESPQDGVRKLVDQMAEKMPRK